ncbi:MAG TPA: extracellular solute-binding protein [Pirellulales bacterium]|jgi:sn-glycerol 3-phosphate transport system substrate-binding protein
MSLVSDLYPSDEVLAGIAMVLVAISITTGVSLLIVKLFERRPTVRHAVLASALVCSLATPLIALLIRTSGASTFQWNLLPAAQAEELASPNLPRTSLHSESLPSGESQRSGMHGPSPQSAGEPEFSVGRWLASLLGNEGRSALERLRQGSAHTTIVSLTAEREERAAQPLAATGSTATDLTGTAEATGHSRAIRRAIAVAMIVWLAGAAILLARIVCGSIHVLRIRRAGKPFLANSRGAIATHLRRYLGTEQLPSILISDAIRSPVATGLLHGTVILPAGLVSKITTDQLCDVLIHECAHVVRRDPLILYLQVIAGSIFWPIPLVHWLNQQLTAACEEICDNYVLAHRDALRYAETLLRVATVVGSTRRGLPFVGMLHLRGRLESRIAGLIDADRNTSTRVQGPRAAVWLTAFLLANVAICGTTIQAQRNDAARPAANGPPKAEALPQAEATPAAKQAPEAKAPQQPDAPAPRTELAAAAAAPKAAEKPAQPIEIEIWWGMRSSLGGAFEKQVKRFNESQNRIRGTVRFFDGYAGVHSALNRAFRDGGLPDAAIVEIHHIASFAADDRIQPLDELAKNDPAFQAEDLLPGILANLRYRDKLYALPMNRSTPILYYNKDRFKAAGLDPDKPPTTWQEMREMSDTLTPDNGSEYGFVAVNSAWFFESMVWSNGGELLVDGKPAFAQSGAGPLQLWADMVHLDHSARVSKGSFGEFSSGRAAMAVESTALLQAFESQCKFNLGTAMLPHSAGSPGAVPTGGGAAVIPAKNSPERQAAAWAFMTWFIKTQQAADWSEATGYIPVRESARTQLRTAGFYDQRPQFEVAVKQMAFAREAPQLPEWGTVWKVIEESMNAVVRDDAPAFRTLKEAEQKVEAVLHSEDKPKP